MKRLSSVVFIGLISLGAITACKKKPADGTGSGSDGSAGSSMVASGGSAGSAMVASGSDGSAGSAVVADGPKCPAGNVLDGTTCKPMITAEKIEAIGQQQTRLDELAKLLDKADTVAAPLELLDAVRQLDEWKKLAAKDPNFAKVEAVVIVLGEAVKTLHAFQAGLKTGASRLGNIKGELDAIMKDTGAAKQLEAVRTQISKEVHEAIDGLTQQAVDAIQKVIVPLKAQFEDVSDMVIGACVIAKQGGNEKVKELCKSAKDIFKQADQFLKDFDTKPQEMIKQLTTQLETQLGELIDVNEKKLMDAAQTAVNDALKLPPAGSGSGSGSQAEAPGSGSAK